MIVNHRAFQTIHTTNFKEDLTMKNYKPVLAALALSMVLLAGCTELPGKANQDALQNTEEEFGQNFGAVIQEEIGKATADIEQNVENAVVKVHDNIKSEGISKELTASGEVGSSSVLHLDNPVGKIEVKRTDGKLITVSATLWFHNTSSHQADRQSIIDNAEVAIKPDGDQLEVTTIAKDHPKKNIWDWAQDELEYSNFTIDYVIEVPSRISAYDITNNVGEVNLNDLRGTYRIVSNVGTVNISGAEITGKSSVETNTGSVHLEIADMSEGSSLTAKTDIGTLTAVLDEALKCSLETKSELGAITGTASGKTDINGGGPLLSLSSSVGAITVNQ
jgi:hypothetical protein